MHTYEELAPYCSTVWFVLLNTKEPSPKDSASLRNANSHMRAAARRRTGVGSVIYDGVGARMATCTQSTPAHTAKPCMQTALHLHAVWPTQTPHTHSTCLPHMQAGTLAVCTPVFPVSGAPALLHAEEQTHRTHIHIQLILLPAVMQRGLCQD